MSTVAASIPPTLGLVLVGGLARRMGGGDKARIAIGGVTILQRVLACLAPQCPHIVINANGGQIEVFKLRPEGGKKMGAADFARERGLVIAGA